jgi:hypothetical protein
VNPNPTAPDPAARLREAAALCRREAAELARQPAPSLVAEYPDVDAAIEHLKVGREMKIRYALAAWLEQASKAADASVVAAANVWGDAACPDAAAWLEANAVEPHALALADAILGEVTR